MTDADYADWADRHAALFSMGREDDAGMFLQWRREFEAMGFTVAELHGATDWISRESKGITRWDHLQAIRDHVRNGRRFAASKARATVGESDRGTCSKCSDTGYVCGLPHLSQLRPEGWLPLFADVPALTQAAVCTCLAGKWIYDAWNDKDQKYKDHYRKPQSLVEYTRLNPQWEAQMRDYAEQRRLKIASDSVTKHADKSKPLASILQKVLDSRLTNR